MRNLHSHNQTRCGFASPAAIRAVSSLAAIAALMLFLPRAQAASRDDDTSTGKKNNGNSSAPAKPRPESKADVEVTGHLSRDAATSGESVRFFIAIENHSDAPLKDIAMEHLDVPGFRLIRRCWSDDAKNPACASSGESPPAMSSFCRPQGDKLCEELPPHQALILWGDLLPDTPAPRSQTFGVIRWSLNGFDSRGIAELGPLQSLGWVRGYWIKVTQDWDLGIAVWLAVFSGLFAYWQHLRDQKEEKAQARKLEASRAEEATRKAKAKADQVEIEQVGRTWQMMLPEIHRLALTHYMPIASTAQGLVVYVRRCQDPKRQAPENIQAALCYTLRFHWRRLKMKRAGASWYFKNRTAEDLIVELVQKHQSNLRIDQAVGREALDLLLPLLDENSTITDTVGKLAGIQGVAKQFVDDYYVWVCTPAAQTDALILSAATKILEYETNRPYLYWYKECQPLKLTAEERRLVEEIAGNPLLDKPDLLTRVKQYLTEAEQEVTIG